MQLKDGLTVLFVALKLTEFINWSWWWVLLPFWGAILLRSIVKTQFPNFWKKITKETENQ